MTFNTRDSRATRRGRASRTLLVLGVVSITSVMANSDAALAAVDTLSPGAPGGAHQTVDGGYLPADWLSSPPDPADEFSLHNCATYLSRAGEVNDPLAGPVIDPADFGDLYVRCNGLGDKNEGDDPADGLVQLTSVDDPESEHLFDGRWAGQYAVISPRTDGLGDVVRLGYCALDSAGHPTPWPGASTADNTIKALFGYSTAPQLDYLLWKHGNTYDDLTAAAVYVANHYFQSDVSPNGSALVPDPATATDDPAINALAVALVAESIAHAGPWTITVDNDLALTGSTVTVAGPGGPIRNESFSVAVTNASGAPGTIVTDSSGQATIAFAHTGGPVTVTVTGRAPSPYLLLSPPEAAPDAQALASTGPGVVVSGSDTTVPGYVQVVKTVAGEQASAAYISPDGTLLELHDVNGTTLGQRTVAGGVANWGPFDAAANPAPYQVYELDAAPGLIDPDPTVPVAAISTTPSTDPNNPTIIVVDNGPEFSGMVIQKLISGPFPSGQTLAGFHFAVTRDDDQSFGTPAQLTTEVQGRTQEVRVTRGIYTVCEVARPDWSLAIQDAPAGCSTVNVTHGADEPALVVEFTNVSNEVRAATRMATPYASPGDVVTDEVWVADTVAGRRYRANITWYRSLVTTAAADVVCDTTTAEFAGSATFTGAAGEVVSQVSGTVPAGAGVAYWAAGTITDVATGSVVAVLPCGDPLERLLIPSISTVSPVAVDPGTPIRDTYTVTIGTLPATATATASIPLHDISAGCEPTSMLVGVLTEEISVDGTFTTTDGVVTNAGVFVFREYIEIDDEIAARPPGFAVNPQGVTGDVIPVSWRSHQIDCDPAETTWVPEVVTQVRDAILSGQPSIDDVTPSGLPATALAVGESVTLVGGLYWHPIGSTVANRTCTAENLVRMITPVSITGNSSVATAGITDYPTGVELSYQEHLEVVRVREINGQTVTDTFSTAPHGCRESSQTQIAPTPSSPTVSTPGGGATAVTITSSAGSLPRSGANTLVILMAAGLLVTVGIAASVFARRRDFTAVAVT